MKHHRSTFRDRPPLSALILTAVGLSLAACTSGKLLAESPTTAPSVRVVKLSDGVDLNQLQSGDRETNLTDKLTRPQASQTIYFGEVDEYGEDDQEPVAALPVIALHKTDSWVALPLVGDSLRNAGWKYVGAGPAPREIWGALDTVAGASRPSFVLAHSTDGGETFELTDFHKPCKLAEFFDFVMNRDGHGRASVALAADCGPHKAGIYHFETSDDGKTWSSDPRYEPDVMIRADEVPDDEQPDDAPMNSKTLLHPKRSAGRGMLQVRTVVAHVCNPRVTINPTNKSGYQTPARIDVLTHDLQTPATDWRSSDSPAAGSHT